MNKRKLFQSVLLLLVLIGCNRGQKSSAELSSVGDTLRYATGFRIFHHEGYTQADVIDPWKEGKLRQRYLLVPRDKSLPANLPKGTVVRTPLRNVVVYTGVHCAMLAAIHATDGIIGVCESKYINNVDIKKKLKEGVINDLGESTAPNIEKMFAIETEVIIASPFNNANYGAVEKTGIPIIECGDYMETNPLGSAEWLKFLALFTDRTEQADSVFNQTKRNYLNLKNEIKKLEKRPTLLTGMKYGSTWYVPSGDSYMSRVYQDAGADYIFSYLKGSGGTPLSFEAVLDKAIHADIWLILYNSEEDLTYSALQSDFSPYSRFDAFRDRHIFGCNAAYSLYHEEIPIHPDYLLKEIAAILHPEAFPAYNPKYFKKLK